MADFFEACIAPTNLVLTILLALCILYWMMVIFGALSMDTFDVDFDADVDVDMDVDVDADADVDVDAHAALDADVDLGAHGPPAVGVGMATLRFFHVGDVPVMILVTLAVLGMWGLGVSLHPYIGQWAFILQLLLLIPYCGAALLATKLLTLPLRAVFRKMREEERLEQHVNFVGQRCRIVSLTAGPDAGQAKVPRPGAPALLNVRTSGPEHILNKGDEAVIVAHEKDSGTYTVRAFRLEI
jgi:hypothetical protein